MNIINFHKAKIEMLAFESETDFVDFCKRLNSLFEGDRGWPRFMVITDDTTKDEDLTKINKFIYEMKSIHADLATIKRNIQRERLVS